MEQNWSLYLFFFLYRQIFSSLSSLKKSLSSLPNLKKAPRKIHSSSYGFSGTETILFLAPSPTAVWWKESLNYQSYWSRGLSIWIQGPWDTQGWASRPTWTLWHHMRLVWQVHFSQNLAKYIFKKVLCDSNPTTKVKRPLHDSVWKKTQWWLFTTFHVGHLDQLSREQGKEGKDEKWGIEWYSHQVCYSPSLPPPARHSLHPSLCPRSLSPGQSHLGWVVGWHLAGFGPQEARETGGQEESKANEFLFCPPPALCSGSGSDWWRLSLIVAPLGQPFLHGSSSLSPSSSNLLPLQP